MFEYLMPLLLLRNHPETLLEHTCGAVVRAQIQYGQRHRVPWGISESAYHVVDPHGSYQYKAAIDHGWNESYGLNGGSANIPLAAPGGRVAFVFDPAAHRVYDSVNGVIVTVPGSYQHAVGCGDWSPGCLKTLLTDPDGDGVFTWETRAIPPGPRTCVDPSPNSNSSVPRCTKYVSSCSSW